MSIRIPIAKPELGEAEWRAVREVVESGWVTQGPKVAEFEEAIASYCGASHAVAVSSCTFALHLSLVAAGIGVGDEVIVPSMSYIATANAVVHAGATPVFAEVDPETFNLDVEDARSRISDRTRAILLVHQLGLPADIDAFAALTAQHDLQLIEDAACAIGSRYKGTPIGTHSEFVCFSFHPRKLITTGDGGMILTDSAQQAERLKRLRQHGMTIPDAVRHTSAAVLRERYVEVGFNARMTDIQAALGVEQMRRLPLILERRRTLADSYDQRLAGHPLIATPLVPEWAEWNVQTYSVRLLGFDAVRRDVVMQKLLDLGIATRPGIMTSHREPAYAHDAVHLPVSEAASDGSLALPLHTHMTIDDVHHVADALIEVVGAS